MERTGLGREGDASWRLRKVCIAARTRRWLCWGDGRCQSCTAPRIHSDRRSSQCSTRCNRHRDLWIGTRLHTARWRLSRHQEYCTWVGTDLGDSHRWCGNTAWSTGSPNTPTEGADSDISARNESWQTEQRDARWCYGLHRSHGQGWCNWCWQNCKNPCPLDEKTSQEDPGPKPTETWWLLWSRRSFRVQDLLQQCTLAWGRFCYPTIFGWRCNLGWDTDEQGIGQTSLCYVGRGWEQCQALTIVLQQTCSTTRWRARKRKWQICIGPRMQEQIAKSTQKVQGWRVWGTGLCGGRTLGPWPSPPGTCWSIVTSWIGGHQQSWRRALFKFRHFTTTGQPSKCWQQLHCGGERRD